MNSKPIPDSELLQADAVEVSEHKMKMGCMHCHKVIDADASHCSGCQSTDPFGIRRRKEKWKLHCLLASVTVVMGLWCLFRLGFFE